MSHIGENIDELFRKAAEDYPLNIEQPDWESFSQKMANDLYKKKDLKEVIQKTSFAIAITAMLFVPFKINDFFVASYSGNNNNAATVSNNAPTINITNNLAQETNNYKKANIISLAAANDVTDAALIKTQHTPDIVTQVAVSVINADETTSQNIAAQTAVVLPTEKIATKADEVKTAESETANTSKQALVKLRIPSKKKFYIGATIAPELASVKHQSISKIGYSAGFLLGYKINNKLQVEAGMSLSHKYYYTNGKYTEPNTLRRGELPVNNVNAFTSVTEIPVTIQYNVCKTSTSRIYASVGTVSSLVHKDRYDYDFTRNNGDKSEGLRKFNKSFENLFSNINISAGYEQQLGNIASIRIEPYYRLPLNGIGSGNLPVTSVGINFGITGLIK